MIATINFSCTSHCNKKDVLPEEETNEMVEKVSQILNDSKTTDKNRYSEAKCTLDSLLSWGCCVPTTCFYQHEHNQDHPVDIIQYFCIPTLGACYCIKHYWVHCFLAGFFHITHLLSYLLGMEWYLSESAKKQTFLHGGGWFLRRQSKEICELSQKSKQ